MTCSIAWSSFSWEAFATLVTGLAAVVAAFVLGRTQIAIQKKQTDIQAQSLRSDLFDRRYDVFDRTEKFIFKIVNSADYPPRETEWDFFLAMGQARFLFSKEVVSGLEEIRKNCSSYQASNSMMDRKQKITGRFDEEDVKRETDARSWFSERLKSLPELFDEMKLGGQLV